MILFSTRIEDEIMSYETPKFDICNCVQGGIRGGVRAVERFSCLNYTYVYDKTHDFKRKKVWNTR